MKTQKLIVALVIISIPLIIAVSYYVMLHPIDQF